MGPSSERELTITVYRGMEPVLITGDPEVVGAVLAALNRVLAGEPDRARILRLTGEDEALAAPETADHHPARTASRRARRPVGPPAEGSAPDLAPGGPISGGGDTAGGSER